MFSEKDCLSEKILSLFFFGRMKPWSQFSQKSQLLDKGFFSLKKPGKESNSQQFSSSTNSLGRLKKEEKEAVLSESSKYTTGEVTNCWKLFWCSSQRFSLPLLLKSLLFVIRETRDGWSVQQFAEEQMSFACHEGRSHLLIPSQ